MDERKRLEQAIAAQESLRATVGDEVVDETISTLLEKLAHLETPEQQRKLVTILFADIVGSTDIVKHLDPEDALEIMDGSLKQLSVPVEELGGHITRFTGDGFKAVFGMPKAYENDPEMAIRAALGILEVVQEISADLENQWDIHDFQVRVGINTGLAALGGMTEAEDTVMGSTVNLAKRVESATPPGGMLITHNTYHHVRGIFTMREHEPIEAKGFDEPVPVYRVLEVKPRAFRVQTRGVEGVETRMMGRKVELLALQQVYRDAIEAQQTNVVTVVGEAGVGKSRLLYEFDNWIELLPDEVRFFQGRGRRETQFQPYALLKDVFTFRFQIQESDKAIEVHQKLVDGFCEVLRANDEGQMCAHIIGQLLGFDFSESQHVKGILDDPQQIRDRGLMYLFEYFQGVSEGVPVVVFLEDIHWADDSSLDMLNHLARRIPEQRILIVCVARHRLYERHPNWGEGLAYHRRVELQPLTNHDSSQLVTEILQKVDQVPDLLQNLVVKRAEGNPFYIEELIKMLIEDGVIVTGEEWWQVKPDRLAEVDVPDTLMGVLQARLEGLPQEERNTLQQASVVGHIFWDDTVAYINTEISATNTHYELRTTESNLSSLRSRELIYHHEESAFTDAVEYTFKHAILRDVTYESVLKRVRKAYHGLVAEWLIQHSGERAGEYAGLIADNLERAGEGEQAAIFLYQAGEGAAMRYANSEAMEYFTRALDLTPEDDLVGHYNLLMAREKMLDIQGDRESQSEDLAALKEIAIALDGVERQSEVALRYANHFSGLSNFQSAIESALEAIDLAKEIDNREMESVGYKLLGSALKKQDAYEESRDNLEKGLKLAQEAGHIDLAAEIYGLLGSVDVLKGDYSEARDNYDQALAIHRELGNLPSECSTVNWLGNLEYYQGKYSEAHVYYEKVLVISREIGDRYSEVLGLANLGNIDNCQGDYSRAKERYEYALLIAREIGNRETEAALLFNLSNMSIRLGLYPLAKHYLDQCLIIYREIESRSGESWVLMGLGEVASRNKKYPNAHEYCKQAIKIACEIGYTDQEGYALSRIGDALIGMEQLGRAEIAHQKSLHLRQELDQQHLVIESKASLARVAFKRGDLSIAQNITDSILSYLDEGNTLDNTEKPFRIYLTCYEVLKVNNNPRADTILEEAYNLLQERTVKISDEELRHSFLDNVAENREIVKEYEENRLGALKT